MIIAQFLEVIGFLWKCVEIKMRQNLVWQRYHKMGC